MEMPAGPPAARCAIPRSPAKTLDLVEPSAAPPCGDWRRQSGLFKPAPGDFAPHASMTYSRGPCCPRDQDTASKPATTSRSSLVICAWQTRRKRPVTSAGLRLADLLGRQLVELPPIRRQQHGGLLAGLERLARGLAQDLPYAAAALDTPAGLLVQTGREAGEGLQLLELGVSQPQVAGDAPVGRIPVGGGSRSAQTTGARARRAIACNTFSYQARAPATRMSPRCPTSEEVFAVSRQGCPATTTRPLGSPIILTCRGVWPDRRTRNESGKQSNKYLMEPSHGSSRAFEPGVRAVVPGLAHARRRVAVEPGIRAGIYPRQERLHAVARHRRR